MEELGDFKEKDVTQSDINNKMRELFKLQILLEEKEKDIEDERKLIEIQKGLLERQQRKNMLLKQQLENQKSLFDRQWQLLELETKKLVAQRDKFEREKLMFRDDVYREARRSMSVAANTKIMFKGVDDTESLKKRYKELIKIYHPDNANGDNELVQAITTQYEELKRFYLGI